MTSVDLVKPSPLLCGQRTENRVVEYAGTTSESLLGICECRIHGNQCIVKATKRLGAQFRTRYRMLRRFNSRGKAADSQNVNTLQPLLEIGLSALGLPGVHGAQHPFRGGRIGEQKMFQDLSRIPLANRRLR